MPSIKDGQPAWAKIFRKEPLTKSAREASSTNLEVVKDDVWIRQPKTEQRKAEKLGIDPATKNSKILEAFKPKQFAEVRLAPVPGKIVWANPELARELGFPVSLSNQMDERLEKALLEKLSYHVIPAGDGPEPDRVITGYADRYGGFGIGYNEGAGRAAFLPYGNLNVKGVGRTPLSKKSVDFQHSHGGAPMREGFLEAIWGEVGENLFSEGSTRILAVIDTNDYTEWEDGTKERRALIVRAGDQVRPAHFLDRKVAPNEMVPMFINSVRLTGDLVEKQIGDDKRPDINATFKRIIKKQANSMAERFRFRILHGAPSPSNMELNGTQLDLATIQSQPRTANIHTVTGLSSFGNEHFAHMNALEETWDTISSRATGEDRKAYSIGRLDVLKEFMSAYKEALTFHVVSAIGLKGEAVRALQEKHPETLTAFRELLIKMSKLSNQGSVNADKEIIDDISVLDVFGALARIPEIDENLKSSQRTDAVEAAFKPNVRSKDAAKRVKLARDIRRMVQTFDQSYQKIIQLAATDAQEHYDDVASMKRSIAHRAAFENKELDSLYRATLTHNLDQAIETYGYSGDVGVFTDAVDKTITNSLRNVDEIRAQGTNQMRKGVLSCQRKTIDGVGYGIDAFEGGKRQLTASLFARKTDFNQYELDIPGKPVLSLEQLRALRYRFSTDGWKEAREVPVEVDTFLNGADCKFDIPVLRGEIGRLEGLFHCTADGDFWLKDGANNFAGYNFVVPDEKERAQIQENFVEKH